MPQEQASSEAQTTLATAEDPQQAAVEGAAVADDAQAEKAAADAAEAERVAKLTPEQKQAEDEAKAKADAEAKAKADAEERAKRAPEKYELSLPDGMKADAEVSGEFEATARKLGLTQEEAQELYALGAKANQRSAEAMLADVKALQESWLSAAQSDKEFGGEKLKENLAVAKTALKFATPELKQILNETRLGDHPELIRWMYRVGKAMAEDTFVTGRQSATRDSTEAARADRMYPTMSQ